MLRKSLIALAGVVSIVRRMCQRERPARGGARALHPAGAHRRPTPTATGGHRGDARAGRHGARGNGARGHDGHAWRLRVALYQRRIVRARTL